MWEPQEKKGCNFSVHKAKTPPGEQEHSLWHVYGSDASTIIGQVSIYPELSIARVTKGFGQDGEVVEIILANDELNYPTRLYEKLALVNRLK